MYRLEVKIIDESSGATLRHATAYVDVRYGQVCLDSLRRICEDAQGWLRLLLEKPPED